MVSVGVIDERGREYYAVNADMDEAAVRAHPWLVEHVWPHLPRTPDGGLDRGHISVKPAAQLRQELADYFAPRSEGERAVVYAYFGAQDLVHLQGLWGHDWSWMPPHVPRWVEDLKAMAARQGGPPLPEFELGGHHALQDARCNQLVHRKLEAATEGVSRRPRKMLSRLSPALRFRFGRKVRG